MKCNLSDGKYFVRCAACIPVHHGDCASCSMYTGLSWRLCVVQHVYRFIMETVRRAACIPVHHGDCASCSMYTGSSWRLCVVQLNFRSAVHETRLAHGKFCELKFK